jgi:hypothetical protein
MFAVICEMPPAHWEAGMGRGVVCMDKSRDIMVFGRVFPQSPTALDLSLSARDFGAVCVR